MVSQHQISDQGYLEPVTRQDNFPLWSVKPVCLCLFICIWISVHLFVYIRIVSKSVEQSCSILETCSLRKLH